MQAQVVRTVLVFEIGSAVLALPSADVRRVTPMAALATPPACPPVVLGVLDLGGTAIPVLHLDRLLGLPEFEPGVESHLLVLARDNPPLALAVGAARELCTLAEDELQEAGSESLNDCVAAAFSHRGATAYLLDTERLLLRQEQCQLAQLHEMEQARLDGAVGIR